MNRQLTDRLRRLEAATPKKENRITRILICDHLGNVGGVVHVDRNEGRSCEANN
jgi:hypothetical protein